MPKTINDAARAVTKATRLMPVDFWANPAPSAAALVVSEGDSVAVDGNGVVELLIGVDAGWLVGWLSVFPSQDTAIPDAETGHARWPHGWEWI